MFFSDYLPDRLEWWVDCLDPAQLSTTTDATTPDPLENSTVEACNLPFSCCPTTHAGGCYESAAFSNPCKIIILEIFIRCIMYACGLLAGAAVFGGMGTFFYFRAAIAGIEVQKRYQQWMDMTGQTGQDDDD